jgi:hypothetical protein
LGSFILHAEAGSRIKFWSVGKDGRDDGGDAGKHCTWWLPGPIPGKAASPESRVRVAAKDLVIEVRRRQ